MASPSVAVVILNWNGKKYLEQFLPSVLASTYCNFRVVIGDNASTDGSVEYLESYFPQVQIIQNASNEGFAQGYNSVLKKVEADYYVLLNSDVEVRADWIDPVIGLMESDKQIGACQPKILSFSNKDYFEYAGACGGWIDKFGYPFARGRVLDNCELDNGQYEGAAPCFWATGAALFVRASVFTEMGGFDEYFFAHQEEIDLCWRMQSFGYSVYVQPQSVVYHVGGGTLPKGNSRKVYLNFRNNLIMLAKNLPFLTACWKIQFRFGLDALAAYKALFMGDFGYFFAVGKAHFHFIFWLFFIKNKLPKPTVKRKLRFGYYRGSLLYQYYIKKKRKFSEIIGS